MDPFFILGAPRSGTTMLRDVLRQSEHLCSPEETHFFRWASPFRSEDFLKLYKNNRILLKHRGLDNVSDEAFDSLAANAVTRGGLMADYGNYIANQQGGDMWFDKTPQNVYGLPLIIEQFPQSPIIHLVRSPFAVVRSLLEGDVLRVKDVVGAANYWYESVSIVNVMKPVLGSNLVEIKYEDFTRNPKHYLDLLSDRLGMSLASLDVSHVTPAADDGGDRGYFSVEILNIIQQITEKYAGFYGYSSSSSEVAAV